MRQIHRRPMWGWSAVVRLFAGQLARTSRNNRPSLTGDGSELACCKFQSPGGVDDIQRMRRLLFKMAPTSVNRRGASAPGTQPETRFLMSKEKSNCTFIRQIIQKMTDDIYIMLFEYIVIEIPSMKSNIFTFVFDMFCI